MSTSNTRVQTPVATLSYPHIAEPQESKEEGKKPKYSIALVFAPGTDLRAMQAAELEAAKEKFGETITIGGKKVKVEDALRSGALRSAFRRDAEAKGYDAGSVFVNARSEQKPGCVYRWGDPNDKSEKPKPENIPDDRIKDALYAGAQVRATLRAFGYDNSGNRGVSFALNNIQLMGDGKRLDNRVAAADEFDADLSSAPADLNAVL